MGGDQHSVGAFVVRRGRPHTRRPPCGFVVSPAIQLQRRQSQRGRCQLAAHRLDLGRHAIDGVEVGEWLADPPSARALQRGDVRIDVTRLQCVAGGGDVTFEVPQVDPDAAGRIECHALRIGGHRLGTDQCAEPRQRHAQVGCGGVLIEIGPHHVGKSLATHRSHEREQLEHRPHTPPAHVLTGGTAIDAHVELAEHANAHGIGRRRRDCGRGVGRSPTGEGAEPACERITGKPDVRAVHAGRRQCR